MQRIPDSGERMADIPCAACRMRQRYEENPHSIIGRFWRWHTHFCPGWKAYLASLSEDERNAIQQRLDEAARRA